MKRHEAQLRYAYQKQVSQDWTLSGKVVVSMTVGGDGKVSSVRISSTTLANGAVEEELVQRFHRMVFPASDDGEASRVDVPLIFRTE